MTAFRLMSARTVDRIERRPWRVGYRPPPSPPISVSFAGAGPLFDQEPKGSQVSVLLGKNGEGKSRLLSSIATSFQLLQDYARAGSPRGLPLSRLEYIAKGHHHLIVCPGARPQLFVDHRECPIQEAILPARVIGLSMTPFDKFPIGTEPRQLDLFMPEQSEIYAYLGMRERMGRSSTTAMLTRTIEGMFSRSSISDRGRVKDVFALLGFETAITTVYRIEGGGTFQALAEGASLAAIRDLQRNRGFLGHRTQSVLDRDENAIEELRASAISIAPRVDRNFVSLVLDVSNPNSESLSAYQDIQKLRQAGLVRLFAVEVGRPDGTLIDLKEASSGELSMALTFMSLAANLDDEALVLIDEPETNLHPEWQSKYIELLLRTFKQFYGCHYVLATHSPLILRDAPPESTVASLHDPRLQSGREVAGQPVDYLLVKAFDVASGSNYYIQEELIKALRLAADGKSTEADFVQTVYELSKVRPLIKDSPGVVALINDLQKIAERSRAE